MYSSQAARLRQPQVRTTRRNRNLATYKTGSRDFGPVSTTIFFIVIMGVLALLYLTQITKTSVYGYQVNELSTEREALLERQQELQVEAARLQSVARIEQSPVVGGLEPESQVSYDTNR